MVVMTYGKYAGKDLNQIYKFDPKYLKHLIKLKYFQIGFSEQCQHIQQLIKDDEYNKRELQMLQDKFNN